jgi:type VI secretion system lysozyme-like protein
LFERLGNDASNDPGKPPPVRVYGRVELRESIRRELVRLLNTRCTARRDRNGTVIDYGIPDFSWMSASSADDRQLLAETLARKIASFEPRLREVRVTIEPDASDVRCVVGSIEATLVVETIRESVSFPLAIRNKSGEAVLSADPYPGYGY